MSRCCISLLVVLLAAPLFAAEEPPATRTTNDRQIIDLLARIHDQGAALFNAGDHGGCYRMFQGSLVTIKLVLPKEVQEAVDRGLARAELAGDPVRRAMALHELFEDVRKKLHPTAGKGELLPKPREAKPDAGTPPKAVVIPGVPEPKKEEPKFGPAASRPIEIETPKASPFSTPEPPMAPSAPPGRINLDAPPVISGVPTSNPKSPRPMPDETPKETLTVPPRPIDPAPLEFPTRPKTETPALEVPPAPLTTPKLGTAPLEDVPPPLPKKPKTDGPAPAPPWKSPAKSEAPPLPKAAPAPAGPSPVPDLTAPPLDPPPSAKPAAPPPLTLPGK